MVMPMMRRALLPLLLLLIACSATSRPAPDEPRAKRADLNPFFWQVDGPKGPSYLLGTFHIGVSADEVYPKGVWHKLARCDAVLFEMNTKSLQAFGLGMLPHGESLDQKMTPKQWDELLRLMEVTPDAAEKLKRFKVWLLHTTFLHTLVPETKPIDTEVEERALAAQKRVQFLEDVREQERILERHQTVARLLKALRNREAARKSIQKEMAVYKSGDEREFAELTLSPEGLGEAALKELVYDRNESWIPAFEAEMEKGCVFLVVGASHLVGERGVVDLLRKKGYRVTRIRD
jgi:uncharacterized protein YbaP (TraB family)